MDKKGKLHSEYLKEKFKKYIDEKDFFASFIMYINSIEDYTKLLLNQLRLLENLLLIKNSKKSIFHINIKAEESNTNNMTLGQAINELKKYHFDILKKKEREVFLKHLMECNKIRIELIHKLNHHESNDAFEDLCKKGVALCHLLSDTLVKLTTFIGDQVKGV